MRAKRVDQNQKDIVRDLRKCGYSVIDLSRIGNGIPDILVSGPSDMWLCEIKSAFGRLNPLQERWHLGWRGKPVIIGRTFDEIFNLLK